ncbi:MAG: glycine--tRNA ligase subunit beta, partial [Holosporales bacterium]|nr:glycine--tRNA ligase subunit beta [Holosporales bacterium]
MAELLFEILNEEMPARFQEWAACTLVEKMRTACEEAGIQVKRLQAFVTPRRLVLHGNLTKEGAAYTEERRGPKEDAPENVRDGFFKNLPKGSITEKRNTPKGTYWFAT